MSNITSVGPSSAAGMLDVLSEPPLFWCFRVCIYYLLYSNAYSSFKQ